MTDESRKHYGILEGHLFTSIQALIIPVLTEFPQDG